MPERLAEADAAVLGRVTLIEKIPFTDAEGRRLAIARIKVEEDLLGTRDKATLRVGFISPRAYFPLETPLLVSGQKVCLFLLKEPGHDFYQILGAQGASGDPPAISKTWDEYEKTVAAARRAAPLLRNPEAGLASKNPEERMLTAWMLAVRYRRPFLQFPEKGFVERPLDPWESRRILQNLVLLADKEPEALWALFWDLGLEPWKIDVQEEFAPNAKKWLRENAVTWRFRERVP